MSNERKFCVESIRPHKRPASTSECSARLLNWEEWNDKRNKLFSRFQKKLGRKPGELITNYGEDYRKIKRERTLVEYTNINTHFDKYRGNPDFWTLPDKLKERSSEDNLQYFAIKSCAKRNFIPPVEHISTPEFILKEKRIYPLLRSVYRQWSSSNYRKNQLQFLNDKLKNIQPHTTDASALFVVGKKIFEMGLQKTIEETVKSSQVSLKPTRPSCFEVNHIKHRVSFKLNQKQMEDAVRPPVITYFFDKSDFKSPIRDTVALENTGRSTIRVHWERVDRFFMFRDDLKVFENADNCFYFGKQEILVEPGKTVKIPLWFLPKKPGVYMEKWNINTVPKISDENCVLTVIFHSITEKEKYEETAKRIREYVENGKRNSLITACLNDIFAYFKYVDCPQKMCSISAKQLFEARNMKWVLGLKKPAYVYEESIIKKLYTFYINEIQQENDPNFHTVSCDDMKIIARKADIIESVKKQTELFEITKVHRFELELFGSLQGTQSKDFSKASKEPSKSKSYLKKQTDLSEIRKVQRFESFKSTPSKDFSKVAEDPSKPKQSVKKQTELCGITKVHRFELEQTSWQGTQSEDLSKASEEPSKLKQLKHILNKFEAPLMIPNYDKEKYVVAFIIFRRYITRLCDKLEETERKSANDHLPCLNVNQLKINPPERFINETFDDTWIPKSTFVTFPTSIFAMTPKPDNLINIPRDNIETIHKVYFLSNKDEHQPKKSLFNLSRNSVDTKLSISNETNNITIANLTDDNMDKLSTTGNLGNEELNYQRYILFYTTLQNAIDNIVDFLESFKKNVIRTNVVEEIVQTKENDDKRRNSLHWNSFRGKELGDSYYINLLEVTLLYNSNVTEYILKGKIPKKRSTIQQQDDDQEEKELT